MSTTSSLRNRLLGFYYPLFENARGQGRLSAARAALKIAQTCIGPEATRDVRCLFTLNEAELYRLQGSFHLRAIGLVRSLRSKLGLERGSFWGLQADYEEARLCLARGDFSDAGELLEGLAPRLKATRGLDGLFAQAVADLWYCRNRGALDTQAGRPISDGLASIGYPGSGQQACADYLSFGHWLFEKVENRAEAVRYLQAARQLARETSDPASEARACFTLGFLFSAQRRSRECASMHRQAVELYANIGDRPNQARNLAYLGICSRDEGDYDAAEDYWRQARPIFTALDMLDMAAQIDRDIESLPLVRAIAPGARWVHSESLPILDRPNPFSTKHSAFFVRELGALVDDWFLYPQDSIEPARLIDELPVPGKAMSRETISLTLETLKSLGKFDDESRRGLDALHERNQGGDDPVRLPVFLAETPEDLEELARIFQAKAAAFECECLFRGQSQDFFDKDGLLHCLPAAYRAPELLALYKGQAPESKPWLEVLRSHGIDLQRKVDYVIVQPDGCKTFISIPGLRGLLQTNKAVAGLLQHYGFPTTSLDVTSELWVAVFFALRRAVQEEELTRYEDLPRAAEPSLYIFLHRHSNERPIFDLREVAPNVRNSRPTRQSAFAFPIDNQFYWNLDRDPEFCQSWSLDALRYPTAIVKLGFTYSAVRARGRGYRTRELFPRRDSFYRDLIAVEAPFLVRY